MNYGMFTTAGNRAVSDFVEFAKAHALPKHTVLGMMDQLQKVKDLSEITDTEVRECVGEELGWYQ